MVLSHYAFCHSLYPSQSYHEDPETADSSPAKGHQACQNYKLLEQSLTEQMKS